MTLKKLVFWIFSTLLLSAVMAIVVGYTIGAITGIEMGEFQQILLTGLTFGAVAELGFFSYLVFNWLARGFFRNQSTFAVIQGLLVIIIIGNLIYLNVSKFSGTILGSHLLIPLLILLVGAVIAWIKARRSSTKSFIPTLFFMVGATTLEAIPSINSRAGELPLPFVMFTVLILLACNSYQILQLSWLVKKNGERRMEKGELEKA